MCSYSNYSEELNQTMVTVDKSKRFICNMISPNDITFAYSLLQGFNKEIIKKDKYEWCMTCYQARGHNNNNHYAEFKLYDKDEYHNNWHKNEETVIETTDWYGFVRWCRNSGPYLLGGDIYALYLPNLLTIHEHGGVVILETEKGVLENDKGHVVYERR